MGCTFTGVVVGGNYSWDIACLYTAKTTHGGSSSTCSLIYFSHFLASAVVLAGPLVTAMWAAVEESQGLVKGFFCGGAWGHCNRQIGRQ